MQERTKRRFGLMRLFAPVVRRLSSSGKPGSSCIIHVGMHKTGSTSIQQSLEGFEDERFYYAPLAPGGNHSLSLYSLFASRAANHHLHREARRDAKAVENYNKKTKARLDTSIRRARGRTVIFSGEDLSRLPRHDIPKLRDFFAERFNGVTVVAYVRSPAGFMTSSFQQRVKGATVTKFEPETTYPKYYSAFAKYDEAFGPDNVKLWKFDPNKFPDADVVQDFCEKLGINLAPNKILRTNESLSRQAVAILYAYGKFRRYGEESGPRLRGVEGAAFGELIGGDRFRFSPDLLRPILADHEDDLRWMEQRLGESLREDLGESRPGDVRGEADLLNLDPVAVQSLLAALGQPEDGAPTSPNDVAQLVQIWHRQKVRARGRRRARIAPSGSRRREHA